MKILFIAKGMPNLIKSAGDVRAFNLLSILREQHNILVMSFSADYGDSDVKRIGCQTQVGGDVPRTITSYDPDLIIFSHWSVANPFMGLAKQHAKVIIDTIDIEFLRQQRYHDFVGESVFPQSSVHTIRGQEIATYKNADAIILTAEQDQEEVLKYGDFKTGIFPCVYDINPKTEYVKNNKAYFIANWSHPPNVQSTEYLIDKILPKVEIELNLVGKHTPQKFVHIAKSNNKLIINQAVYNLPSFLNQMSICLAPILYGAGMNGKIGEALAFGIPVVTTNYGAKPYGIEHHKTGMIANTENEYIDNINVLLNNPELADSIRKAGKELMSKFTKQFWKEDILEFINNYSNL